MAHLPVGRIPGPLARPAYACAAARVSAVVLVGCVTSSGVRSHRDVAGPQRHGTAIHMMVIVHNVELSSGVDRPISAMPSCCDCPVTSRQLPAERNSAP